MNAIKVFERIDGEVIHTPFCMHPIIRLLSSSMHVWFYIVCKQEMQFDTSMQLKGIDRSLHAHQETKIYNFKMPKGLALVAFIMAISVDTLAISQQTEGTACRL